MLVLEGGALEGALFNLVLNVFDSLTQLRPVVFAELFLQCLQLLLRLF